MWNVNNDDDGNVVGQQARNERLAIKSKTRVLVVGFSLLSRSIPLRRFYKVIWDLYQHSLRLMKIHEIRRLIVTWLTICCCIQSDILRELPECFPRSVCQANYLLTLSKTFTAVVTEIHADSNFRNEGWTSQWQGRQQTKGWVVEGSSLYRLPDHLKEDHNLTKRAFKSPLCDTTPKKAWILKKDHKSWLSWNRLV